MTRQSVHYTPAQRASFDDLVADTGYDIDAAGNLLAEFGVSATLVMHLVTDAEADATDDARERAEAEAEERVAAEVYGIDR